MNISKIMALTLYSGGVAMATVVLLASIMHLLGNDYATLFVKTGIVIAIMTPFASVTVAMILLLKKGETRYGLFAIIVLVLIAFTVFWRMFV